MFLQQLLNENPKLLDFGKKLLEKGTVEPDTYIIDLDTLLENGKKLLEKANILNIKLYIMTKQFGRNPYIASKLLELGYQGVVAVDYREAQVLFENGIKIGHIGHLVQLPNNSIEKYLKMSPEVITVYSIEKIKYINEAAKKLGIKQKILLKIIDDDSVLYDMQESGFHINELSDTVNEINKFDNIIIEGITSFPCILFEDSKPKMTNNLKTLKNSKKILSSLGIEINQLNCPSGTCIKSLHLLKKNECTHGEPGHSLTGTIPDFSVNRQEKIAMIYLSEISHNFKGSSYCFGGGYYRRGNLKEALINRDKNWIKVGLTPPNSESIDYYFKINEKVNIGEPVFMCFRTQVFVTRSKVVVIEGLQKGSARIVGTWDSLGSKLKD